MKKKSRRYEAMESLGGTRSSRSVSSIRITQHDISDYLASMAEDEFGYEDYQTGT